MEPTKENLLDALQQGFMFVDNELTTMAENVEFEDDFARDLTLQILAAYLHKRLVTDEG